MAKDLIRRSGFKPGVDIEIKFTPLEIMPAGISNGVNWFTAGRKAL